LETIENLAFGGCSSLDEIKIPSTVTVIGDTAFYGCPIKEIELPEQLIVINYNTFANCTKLESIVIPKNVKKIREGAFQGCTALTSVTLPDGLESLDSGFDGCTYYNSGFTYSRVPHFRLYVVKDTAGEKYAQGLKFYDNGLQKNGYYLYTLDAVPSGDVNKDGEFSVVDVIQFQKWLLKVPDVTLSDWKAVDFYADGVLNIYDLALMKRALINQSETIS